MKDGMSGSPVFQVTKIIEVIRKYGFIEEFIFKYNISYFGVLSQGFTGGSLVSAFKYDLNKLYDKLIIY